MHLHHQQGAKVVQRHPAQTTPTLLKIRPDSCGSLQATSGGASAGSSFFSAFAAFSFARSSFRFLFFRSLSCFLRCLFSRVAADSSLVLP